MRATGMFYVAENEVGLREYEIGDPDYDEVQIELKVTALCAWDQALYKGILPEGVSYPFLHGHEGVGIVRKVGPGVTGFEEGDKVTAMGDEARLFGHIANVRTDCLAKLDDDVEDYENWLAEPVSCVMNGIEWCKIRPGDRVAVVGTGFMGLLLVQGLTHSLAHEVIAMDIDRERLGLAKHFGADQIIDLGSERAEKALAALEENPVDTMVEAAGVQAAFDLNYRMVRPAGTFVVFSWHKDGDRLVDLGHWHMNGTRVYNASPGISTDFPRIFARTVPMMKKGVFDIKPLITHVLPVEAASDMFEIATHKRYGYIKGVLTW